ncbi:hypothetical protein BDY19DRAFT_908910 [Irpex rosettiformis]|uniref:Uncharacterized protein n=1 Tax=Irpex rosettiformis TaxID=378272 RepID=A0ACB8TUI0_9APHY|nr:hypothetical protein BDY19DRAFT_908910 [Irpex rosettiformis]
MKVFGLLTALQVLGAVGAAVVQQRDERDDFINAITQPTTGTTIQPGETFPFHYAGGSRCHLLYTAVNIWLLDHQPALSDFNSSGSLLGPSLSYLGKYVTINIGCMIAGEQNFTPIPTIPNNLTMPILEETYLGASVFLTATQSENGGCPVYYPTGFDVSFVELQYGGE